MDTELHLPGEDRSLLAEIKGYDNVDDLVEKSVEHDPGENAIFYIVFQRDRGGKSEQAYFWPIYVKAERDGAFGDHSNQEIKIKQELSTGGWTVASIGMIAKHSVLGPSDDIDDFNYQNRLGQTGITGFYIRE